MKYVLLSLLAITFFSCAKDDDNSLPINEDPSEEIPFVITKRTDSIFSSGGIQANLLSTAIINNQRQDTSQEIFIDGVSQGIEAYGEYEYEGGLVTYVNNYIPGEEFRYYNYDSSDNLSNADWTLSSETTLYYRFLYPSENVVIFERSSLPFSDPDATINKRVIGTFDADDNLVSAGYDMNFDGEMDYTNTFAYTDGNLISASLDSGTTYTFTYSDIKDTEQLIEQATYGKRMTHILCIELFGQRNIPEYLLVASNNSTYLTLEESLEDEYELFPNGYFSKRTKVVDAGTDNQTTTVTRYILE